MKQYQSNEIRNISLLGSSGSGKTTLVEAILNESGVIKRKGTVEGQNTVSDYFPVEKEYGYSVFSTIIQTQWNDKKLTFIDCPGSDDFIGGVVTSLNVTDTALILLNTQYGVEVGTGNHFRYAENHNKPVIFVANHLDHEKVDFDRTLEQVKENFGNKVVVIQYPLNPGLDFNAIIDILQMKMIKYNPGGGKPEVLEIPADQKAKADALHDALIEAAAEHDEALMEKFFDEGVLTSEEILAGIRAGVASCGMYPLVTVCGLQNMGVGCLMEFVGNVTPSVNEVPKPVTKSNEEIAPDASAPTSIFVFKTSIEPHIGEVSYFKVMSGTLKVGDDLTNINRGSRERIAQIFAVAGQIRTNVDVLVAGDIGATVKLKDTRTGDTLNAKGCEYDFKAIEFPASKYRRAIKAVSESDDEKLSEVLTRMREEDPTWIVEQSKELKQMIVHGQGEFHLRTLKWRLENNDKIPIEFSEPKIPYRETITKAARADYRHKKQSGGAGQFGEVHMIIEPYTEGMPDPVMYKIDGKEYKISVRAKDEYDLEWGGKLVYYNCIVGGSIDARFLPAILKGIMEKMEEGPLTGSYARDIRVCIVDGKMHPVDSNEISFKLAGRNAFSNAFKKAGPKIMEPIYNLEVLVPSDRMGDVMSDLQGRRAVVMGMSSEKGFEKIMARVPYAEMATYSTALRSITGGRAMYEMSFHEYQQVPPDVQEQLLKEYEAEDDDE